MIFLHYANRNFKEPEKNSNYQQIKNVRIRQIPFNNNIVT